MKQSYIIRETGLDWGEISKRSIIQSVIFELYERKFSNSLVMYSLFFLTVSI